MTELTPLEKELLEVLEMLREEYDKLIPFNEQDETGCLNEPYNEIFATIDEIIAKAKGE